MRPKMRHKVKYYYIYAKENARDLSTSKQGALL